MCKEFNTLIEQSSWHYTAQCEHGTVHLRWGNLTLSLQPDDFTQLTQQVCQGFHTFPSQRGRMRLNIGQTTLEFPFEDVQPLVQLMEQTAERLSLIEEFSLRTSRPVVRVVQPIMGLSKQYQN